MRVISWVAMSALCMAGMVQTGVCDDAELERNKEIVRRNAQGINSRDLGMIAATTSTKLVRHCQATPGVEITSLDQFVAFLEADWLAVPDSKIIIRQLVAEGDRVAVFATYEGTQAGQMGPFPASGKRMSLDFSGIFRIEDGKIAEIWVTWDNMAALVQLGHFALPEREVN